MRPTGRRGARTGPRARTTTPARRSRCWTGCWIGSGGSTTAAKAERAAVDFEDLELRARDLLADPRTRERWAERFALIMIDEFQDTNAVQLGILESLERDNLFAVGDEFQSIYRFRHADVSIFRRRAEGVTRRLNVNFRSQEELLDVLNAAFAPEFGERFAPLRAGRHEAPMDKHGALRLFDPDPPGRPAGRAADHGHARLGRPRRPRPAAATSRGGAARRGWSPTGCSAEVDAGRRAGDIVVLVRATASLRLFEEALEEQGLPTYVVGGRGYWSQEQVRDGLAWLRVLANPHDEEALLNVLASPFGKAHDRRADPARPRRAARSARSRPRSRTAAARSRSCSPTSASAPSERRWKCCSSARSSPRATTSPCSPAPAATAASRTSAS